MSPAKKKRRSGRPKTGQVLKNQYFPAHHVAEMEKLSRKHGVSVSELMRTAVREFLEREKAK